MKRGLDSLRQEFSQTGLDPTERMALRNSLMKHMEKNPLQSQAVFPPSRRSPYKALLAPVAIALVVIILGTSVSFAAERTMPGDMLYPVKTSINEKVLGFFARSNKNKAEYEVKLTSRRLTEAEKLHAQNKLSDDMKTSLSHEISKHVQAASVYVGALATERNTADVQKTSVDLENSLQQHAAILPMLSLVGSSSAARHASSSQSTE